MCLREIAHVNIVAAGRAVAGGVIGAVEIEVRALALRHLQHDGDEVALRPVVFAKVDRCARGVEEAEYRRRNAVRLCIPPEDALYLALTFAIGVERVYRMVFFDGK